MKKRKGKLTGEETIKETTKKLEEEIEKMDLGDEETPNFCSELGEFYKGKEEGKKEAEDQYPEVVKYKEGI